MEVQNAAESLEKIGSCMPLKWAYDEGARIQAVKVQCSLKNFAFVPVWVSSRTVEVETEFALGYLFSPLEWCTEAEWHQISYVNCFSDVKCLEKKISLTGGTAAEKSELEKQQKLLQVLKHPFESPEVQSWLVEEKKQMATPLRWERGKVQEAFDNFITNYHLQKEPASHLASLRVTVTYIGWSHSTQPRQVTYHYAPRGQQAHWKIQK